jgi:hypothetical protein
MVRLMSVKDVRTAFYECAEDDDITNMCDYFETLYQHYKNRHLTKSPLYLGIKKRKTK